MIFFFFFLGWVVCVSLHIGIIALFLERCLHTNYIYILTDGNNNNFDLKVELMTLFTSETTFSLKGELNPKPKLSISCALSDI